jgi:hypothetical protein
MLPDIKNQKHKAGQQLPPTGGKKVKKMQNAQKAGLKSRPDIETAS